MLTLITGRAGTGKTALITAEIAAAVKSRKKNTVLLVPEQYSHEAERELASLCPADMSLYAEVLSFTGLARRFAAEYGGAAVRYLDKAGKLLCMASAMSSLGGTRALRVYAPTAGKTEMQTALLSAVDEMKSVCVGSDRLREAGLASGGALGDKLMDLATVMDAYDAVVSNGRADPGDRLSELADTIECRGVPEGMSLYVDGFTDFTAVQTRVLCALLSAGARLTVCLTMSGESSEVFSLPRLFARRLSAYAREHDIPLREIIHREESSRHPALAEFAEGLFNVGPGTLDGAGAIELCSCESIEMECELAASEAMRLVRERGCRWRDIAIAARGFKDYALPLERAFRLYGVPLLPVTKTALFTKPVPAMIANAYGIISGGWDVDDVLSYMGTGLTGLGREDCDELGNYIFRWQLKASAWLSKSDWKRHPDGYIHASKWTDTDRERIKRINALRRKLAYPLINLQKNSAAAKTASEHARALAAFLEELDLSSLLYKRSEALCAEERQNDAAVYRQIWDKLVLAMEQTHAILGESPIGVFEFARLFTTMLGSYELAAIPATLDCVTAGDFDRMRRRSIRHLIILGASDDRLPAAEEEGGILTHDERESLRLDYGIDLCAEDAELWREYMLIYNCVTLPSESLTMSFCPVSGEGGKTGPSMLVRRAMKMYDLSVAPISYDALRLCSPGSAMIMAAHALKSGDAVQGAAAKYFEVHYPSKTGRLAAAAAFSRGRLSREGARSLYSDKLYITASRADEFAGCRYSYFLKYGLGAQPFRKAELSALEAGTFIHDVMEKTGRGVMAEGGFKLVSDERLITLCYEAIDTYSADALGGFEDKSAREIYLFERLKQDVRAIVLDTAEELRQSEFSPLCFEFNFSASRDIPPISLNEGDDELTLAGIVDRVDGWLKDDKLYLRVADYKTGKKKLELGDIYYGRNFQMLLYLYALCANSKHLYGLEAVPAGVMYIPARNEIQSLTAAPARDEAEVAAAVDKLRRRSGFQLNNPELLDAWESGAEKIFSPGGMKNYHSRKRLLDEEQFVLLNQHIKSCLGTMAGEIRAGSIEASPMYVSALNNACSYCDFKGDCGFVNGENGESCRYTPGLKPEEVWERLSLSYGNREDGITNRESMEGGENNG